MEINICTHCNIKTHIEDFYNKNTECKISNSKRSSELYYGKEDEISNQRKIYYEKNRERIFQKQNDRYMNFEELHKS